MTKIINQEPKKRHRTYLHTFGNEGNDDRYFNNYQGFQNYREDEFVEVGCGIVDQDIEVDRCLKARVEKNERIEVKMF